jgi:hypothetical protein
VVKQGNPFIRLPLNAFALEKGQSVSVSFSKNEIRVEKQ